MSIRRLALVPRPAFEEGVELVLQELRHVGAGGRLCLGDEGRGVLPHQAVQRGPLRAVTLVVDRGAIWRPLGVPADGLHARLPMFGLGRSPAAHRLAIAPTGAFL